MAASANDPGSSSSGLVTSPIPGVSSYQQADVNAMNAYNNALARINAQRMSTLQQYGYTGTIDPTTGTLSNVAVDAYNPYGNLQQLLRGAAQQSMQDQYANEDRGLYGGLANQALSADKYAFGGQSAQMGTALDSALSALQDQQDTAAYTRDSALWQAEQAAAQQAISSGAFDTPDMSGAVVPPYGSTGTDPTSPVSYTPAPPKTSAIAKKSIANSVPIFSALHGSAGIGSVPRATKIISQQVARKTALKKKRG